uniref:Uncharacterized protein n=1 Tax=Oryza punctata TaxID=4537 RepID=A0A0E0LT75_ORYPU
MDHPNKFSHLHDDPNSSSALLQRDRLATDIHLQNTARTNRTNETPSFHPMLVEMLLAMETGRSGFDCVQLLLDLWIDLLVYAARNCNRHSHARQLNGGGCVAYGTTLQTSWCWTSVVIKY